MPVSERLMATGQWNLDLIEETPKSIRDVLDFFGHIYVFDTPQRPGIGDASMIATSRWGGILKRRQTPWRASGENMIAWLGDPNGKGPILETKVGIIGVATTFANYVSSGTSILSQTPAVTLGTATAVAGSHDPAYQWITARQAMDNACAIWGAEYRVNKDATLDYAPVGSTAMFRQTPQAVVMRRSSGRDANVVGLTTTQLDVAIDAEEYITRSLVQDGTGAWTGSTGTATGYKDLKGNLVNMTGPTVSTQTSNASAATLAANLVAAGEVLRNQVTLSSDEFDITRDVIVGDYIYVYNEDSNMVDTTNPVHYRGTIIYPIKLRVLGITWPLERGMGVWYRDKNGAWTDLTNYVVYEAPGASFEVGAASQPMLTKQILGIQK